MNRPRNSAMEREITYGHWLPNDTEHSYTWHNLNVELVATHYNVKPIQVREAMKRIEKKYPPPNPDKNAELARKSPSGDTCKKCGAPIVWMRHQPCDPKIIRGIAADGNKYTVRQDHRETCNPPDNRQAGIEASQVG